MHRALVRRGEVKSRRGTNVKVGEPPKGLGGSENPEGGGTSNNVVAIICSVVEIGLTDLPKSGGGGDRLPIPPPLRAPLPRVLATGSSAQNITKKSRL